MEVAQPVLPVPPLGALVINSSCSTSTLVQYLRCVPNACDSVTVLEELCKRDFTDIFSYLLSLHATHWHKDVLKQLLRKRLFDLSLPALKALQVHFPKLSALTMDDTTGTLQPFIGPLSSMVTSRWDTHDWYYQILHSKQMEEDILYFFSHQLLFCVAWYPHCTRDADPWPPYLCPDCAASIQEHEQWGYCHCFPCERRRNPDDKFSLFAGYTMAKGSIIPI